MARPPFPKTLRQFQTDFATEEACQEYLVTVVGRMALLVRGAGMKERMNWQTKGAISASNAGTRFR